MATPTRARLRRSWARVGRSWLRAARPDLTPSVEGGRCWVAVIWVSSLPGGAEGLDLGHVHLGGRDGEPRPVVHDLVARGVQLRGGFDEAGTGDRLVEERGDGGARLRSAAGWHPDGRVRVAEAARELAVREVPAARARSSRTELR